jgi:hypothetical protein
MAIDDNKVLGASGTNILNLPQGALKALGGQENFQNAMQLAQALQPAPKPIDPALLSFLYFSQMAAEASKPGATALGAASTAALTPAQYLMKDYERQRDREEKLPATALQIANLIKPAKGTGVNLQWKKQNPVTNEDGSVKMDPNTGAAVYNWAQVDGAGNVVKTEQFPDPTSASKAVTMYNQAGESVLVIPGTQEYKTRTSDAGAGGGFFLTSKPKTPSKPSTYVVTSNDGLNVGGVTYKQGAEVLLNNDQANTFSTLIAEPDKEATTIKTVGSGTLAKYMSAEDAKKFVAGLGLAETSPNFQTIVDRLTAKNDSQVGLPIADAGVYLEVVPFMKGDEVINLMLTPSKTAATPYFTLYVNKRLPIIAKNQEDYNTTAREVLPRVDEALALLRTGKVETGKLAQITMPLKQVFNQTFGIKDANIIGLETLQATSNFLAPKMRPKGSGSTSDMEFKAYQQAALYLGNTPEANYISLYAFKKMAENGIAMNRLEHEMLTSGEYFDQKQVNKELDNFDKGIFQKFTGDPEDEAAVLEWYNSLDDGAVVINNGIFDSNSPYIIKGWGS